ncbi:MAG: four helix bundle protein [Ignavibacteria bacterium]|nr:four helix bundle protein [Ignavibacteria bacterium]
MNSEQGITNTSENKRQVFDLQERLINFSLLILKIIEELPNSLVAKHISNQLIRCGTSPTANYAEATSAESRDDFIHKMKISLKELRETNIWLTLIHRKSLLKGNDLVNEALSEVNELIAIFVSSISTAKQNKLKSK